MTSLDEWWANGERVALGEHRLFVQRMGSGEHWTLLHGYPSSSHDWAKIAPALATGRELLMPDFLGFGASDKPAEHVYSITEQADFVEALWARDGVTETTLVAHDYAVSVAQELLARRTGVNLRAVHLMNGGLYPELHRPRPVQELLLDPEQGPKVSAMITEELFTEGLRPTFAESFDAAADSADVWRSTGPDGARIAWRLIRYITDRQEHGERWISALERTDVPLAFVWGMLDPVSGAHMAERIRERLPAAPFVALDGVGHWPMLEAPDRVLAALNR